MHTTNLFSCFGDIIELDLPTWNISNAERTLTEHTGWKRYNPRKPINRYGLSVTSIDGGFSGVPDLDSLTEYNKENNTQYTESSFKTPTPIVDQIPELSSLVSMFSPDVLRSHFLRLDAGGYFPPHRDNGRVLPSKSFRIIVPLLNVSKHKWKWIQEDKLVYFEPGRTYCVNTTKEHSLFSFADNCCMLVLNVNATGNSVNTVINNLAVH